MSRTILSPMPCKVSQIAVKTGDRVKQGAILAVVEAMKMEHVIKAPYDASVAKVNCTEGQLVGEKKVLLELHKD